MNKMTPDELEQFIHRQLRGLPPRRAPRTLESRVLAALEQRATVAWYHRSWSYWPAAVRAAFLAAATGVAATGVIAFYLVSLGVDTSAVAGQAASRFEGLSRLYSLGAWVVDFTSYLITSIPPLWLYGGLATLAALYATVFGLGAAAYRNLYRTN
jgi:hypothetical protein